MWPHIIKETNWWPFDYLLMNTFQRAKFEVGLYLAISKITWTLRGLVLKYDKTNCLHQHVEIIKRNVRKLEKLQPWGQSLCNRMKQNELMLLCNQTDKAKPQRRNVTSMFIWLVHGRLSFNQSIFSSSCLYTVPFVANKHKWLGINGLHRECIWSIPNRSNTVCKQGRYFCLSLS